MGNSRDDARFDAGGHSGTISAHRAGRGIMPTEAATAFAHEMPTTPRHEEAHALSQRPEALGEAGLGKRAAGNDLRPSGVFPAEASQSPVPSLVPLDAVPVLAVPREEVPWDDLGPLATQLLVRLDGCACTMAIVTGIGVPPRDGVRALAGLVSRGLVRLMTQADAQAPELEVGAPCELELDMTVV
jgi:hypothetical protein